MDILDEVQTHVNLTDDGEGNLVQAHWAGGQKQDIGDMTVDQLQEHLETTTGSTVDVAEAIAAMSDPINPISKDLMKLMAQQSGGKPRVPKISAKKRKAKKNTAKVSRKKNRKK